MTAILHTHNALLYRHERHRRTQITVAHGPPFGPVDPVLQVQLVKAALPAGELEFDGQTLHVELAAAPTAAEYVPAPQSVQVAVPVAVPSSSTIQEATNPDETTLPSDVNLTCMYPVLDV